MSLLRLVGLRKLDMFKMGRRKSVFDRVEGVQEGGSSIGASLLRCVMCLLSA